MSEDALYELAQKRVDRRNRRWLLWCLNFFGWLSWVAIAAAFSDAMPNGLGPMVVIIWMGVLIFHGIYLGLAQNRDQEVEREFARLQRALYEDKPKRRNSRLTLREDGELAEDEYDDADFTDDKAYRDSV